MSTARREGTRGPARSGQIAIQQRPHGRGHGGDGDFDGQESADDILQGIAELGSLISGQLDNQAAPTFEGTRITMPRPSLVTSSGPSPVRGFIAAILHPFFPGFRAGLFWLHASAVLAPAAEPASLNRLCQSPYYPVFGRRMVMIAFERRRAEGSIMTDTVLYETAETVAVVRLNRPSSMNALTAEMKTGLLAALRRAAAEPVRAVLITANGRGFCAGQDLVEHAKILAAGDTKLDTVREHYNPIITEIMTMPKPVVAAVNGIAAGAGAARRWRAISG